MREKENFREELQNIVNTFGDRQLIPITEVAKWLGVVPVTLRTDKNFPKKKVGRLYYVRPSQLASWLC